MIKHNKQLESILLAKAVKRFKRTNIRDLDIKKYIKEDINGGSYSLRVDGFKIIFGYNIQEENSNYNLTILTAEGIVVEQFNNTNSGYLPLLKEIYESTNKKIVDSKEKEKEENDKQFEKRLKRLKRIL